MLLCTTENISGKKYETVGLVRGNCIQTKNIVKDFTQGLKHVIGGELGEYTKMMEEARTDATERMIEHAKEMNADAIVMIRYGTGSVSPESAEVLAYGTAVKFIE